jgi:hypothetical protein
VSLLIASNLFNWRRQCLEAFEVDTVSEDDCVELPDPPRTLGPGQSALEKLYQNIISDPKGVVNRVFDDVAEVARENGYEKYCGALGISFIDNFLQQVLERLRHHASDVHPDYGDESPLVGQAATDYILGFGWDVSWRFAWSSKV